MWYDESVFYQFYTLGVCGAPKHNTGEEAHRLQTLLHFLPHLTKLGVSAVYFTPVFESDAHGYDTRDYRTIDRRLGTNEEFADVVKAYHENGLRVVLDGVFNHVGRGFWAFRDVQEKREQSPYRDWFLLRFDGDSPYHDGFYYEGWEGHYELVKLNLKNPAVCDYLLDCVVHWFHTFQIDGLRLDVAYSLDEGFMRRLRETAKSLSPDFFLLGEMLHGDYNRLVNDQMLHSVTNYECYKGLYSSFNSYNFFEIAYSLNRQFGSEPWTLYKGKHLLCFADNHDVTRLASILTVKEHIPLLYTLLFTMPGIPCLYYGSEWGMEGEKAHGDDALRPAVEEPVWNGLCDTIASLCALHKQEKALCYGDYTQVALTNRQYVFARACDGERVVVALNADNAPATLPAPGLQGQGTDLVTGETRTFSGQVELPPLSAFIWRMG